MLAQEGGCLVTQLDLAAGDRPRGAIPTPAPTSLPVVMCWLKLNGSRVGTRFSRPFQLDTSSRAAWSGRSAQRPA